MVQIIVLVVALLVLVIVTYHTFTDFHWYNPKDWEHLRWLRKAKKAGICMRCEHHDNIHFICSKSNDDCTFKRRKGLAPGIFFSEHQ